MNTCYIYATFPERSEKHSILVLSFLEVQEVHKMAATRSIKQGTVEGPCFKYSFFGPKLYFYQQSNAY